jgi:hypothetical protein
MAMFESIVLAQLLVPLSRIAVINFKAWEEVTPGQRRNLSQMEHFRMDVTVDLVYGKLVRHIARSKPVGLRCKQE